MWFRTNIPRVAGEVVDGEAILIDLETGAYYSSDGPGAEIWQMVRGGLCVEDMVDILARRYARPKADLDAQVRHFLGELEARHLVVAVPQDPGGTCPTPPALAEPGEYSPPQLHAFTDMQDLLLLDPIHEVDTQGWPFSQDHKP